MTMADYSEMNASRPQFTKAGDTTAAEYLQRQPDHVLDQDQARPMFRSLASLRFALRLAQATGLITSTAGGAVLAYGVTLHPDALMNFALLSGVMIVFGWALFSRAEDWLSPDLCFDTELREMRVVRVRRDGSEEVMLRRPFDSLGGVRLDARCLSVVERDGAELVSLPIPSREARSYLRDGLSGEIPILS